MPQVRVLETRSRSKRVSLCAQHQCCLKDPQLVAVWIIPSPNHSGLVMVMLKGTNPAVWVNRRCILKATGRYGIGHYGRGAAFCFSAMGMVPLGTLEIVLGAVGQFQSSRNIKGCRDTRPDVLARLYPHCCVRHRYRTRGSHKGSYPTEMGCISLLSRCSWFRRVVVYRNRCNS